MKKYRDPFIDEAGFTLPGMVIALLITLSLIFTSGQVYRIQSVSSEVQNVSDAAVLAAQNEIAEFMIVVRVCDAIVLSLSLTGLVATALGVVTLCIPATAAASEAFLKAGHEIFQARDSFAKKAAESLNSLQKLLPFCAAANAASVATANNNDTSQYLALAIPVSYEGEEIIVGSANLMKQAQEHVDERAPEVKEAAMQAELAAEEANAAKTRAFEHDCGLMPSYCMYERASHLAGLSGTENPLYNTVDTWSFSVALERAQVYYATRLATETPVNSSTEEQARSALREQFYSYASQELKKGYVIESQDSFEAHFPRLPKNTSEMRESELYRESVYPFTSNEGTTILHAWDGCPAISSIEGYGSLSDMEAGLYPECETCDFSAASLGRVAAASSSIDNGFEYHYDIVAQAAQDYQKAREKLDPLTTEVKKSVEGLFDEIFEALKQVGSMRLKAHPPGSEGMVVLTVNLAQTSASDGFVSSFVNTSAVIGARVAISAATLVPDPAEDSANVISSLLDGFAEEGSASTGAAGIILDCWAGLLQGYSKGQEALEETISSSLDALPLMGASGLGSWAADALHEMISLVGLEPANLDALKPVLVNSAHVLAADDSGFSVQLLELKKKAIAFPLQSNDLFSSVVGEVEQGMIESIWSDEGVVEVAVIEILGEEGSSLQVEITLPPAVSEAGEGLIRSVADYLRGIYAQVTGVRVWE